MTNKYVAGFLFSEDYEKVVLIRKNRPAWQKGKLNGVGGHVEPGETPDDAMVREFMEECGTTTLHWKYFGTIKGADFIVDWYKAAVSLPVISTTDEEVDWYHVSDVINDVLPIIPHLKWLIMLALDKDNVTFTAEYNNGSFG